MKRQFRTWTSIARRAGIACLGLACGASLCSTPVFAQNTLPTSVQEQIQALQAAGEFGAAADLAASVREPVRNDARTTARLKQLNGGGANFGQIIQLIMDNTDGIWEEDEEDTEGTSGTISVFQSGIRVDPQGLLASASLNDTTGRLAAVSQQARQAALNDEMAAPSTLRMVSLTRLEKEVSRRLQSGQSVVESMRQLAGLSQIQYVFVYPTDGEIVIAGPAEGWKYNAQGMAIGAQSGRPTLQLDDLVTVLRTFSPAGKQIFGCSIDPRSENLLKVKEYAENSQNNGALSPAGVRSWANRIETLLGQQDISVFGVPANSRVSRVMVEADYRMKLIGTGKLEGGSSIPDYFELLAKNPAAVAGGLDAMRWWMTMKYDAVAHSPDRDAFEIRGSAVLCQSENEFLAKNGQRVATGKAEPVNQQFAQNFTEHYDELARRDPIFADLQGIFDLALTAALIQREHLDSQANWDRGAFAVRGGYRPTVYATPKSADSVVNYKVFNGKDVVLQAAGGVRGDVAAMLNNPQLHQESPRLDTVADSAKAGELPAGRWWWDAK